MPHIDEGELHAWLDGALGERSPTDADRVARHLEGCAGCRERLERAREVRERASELLSAAAPADATPPPFEEVRAARRARGSAPASPSRGSGARTLAWAASLLLAVGAGWTARALLGGDRDAPPPAEAPAATAAAREAADAAPATGASRPGPDRAFPWIAVAAEEASRWIGGALITLPDLPVTGTEISFRAGGPVVRTRQSLPDGTPVDLLQAPERERAGAEGEGAAAKAAPPAEDRVPAGEERTARSEAAARSEEAREPAAAAPTPALETSLRGFRMVISAPVASDSLHALLSTLRGARRGGEGGG